MLRERIAKKKTIEKFSIGKKKRKSLKKSKTKTPKIFVFFKILN